MTGERYHFNPRDEKAIVWGGVEGFIGDKVKVGEYDDDSRQAVVDMVAPYVTLEEQSMAQEARRTLAHDLGISELEAGEVLSAFATFNISQRNSSLE